MNERLVILARSLPHHHTGGMEAVTWDLARQFVRDDLPVTVITTSLGGDDGRFIDQGVEIVPLSDTSPNGYGREWWRTSSSEVVGMAHSVRAVLSVSVAGMGALRLKSDLPNVPFVFQAHGTSAMEFASKIKSRRLKQTASSVKNLAWLPRDLNAYRRFDHIVAVGPAVERSLERWPLGLATKGRVRLIPNGIDTSCFTFDSELRSTIRRSLGFSPQTPVIVTASRLHRQKRVDLGLKAFRRLIELCPMARYLLIGDGPERRNLEDLATKLGIASKTSFVGNVHRESLAGHLSAADVFLMTTTRAEGLPMAALEALACGLRGVIPPHLTGFDSAQDFILRAEPQSRDVVANRLIESLRHPRAEVGLLPTDLTLTRSAERYRTLLGEESLAGQG